MYLKNYDLLTDNSGVSRSSFRTQVHGDNFKKEHLQLVEPRRTTQPEPTSLNPPHLDIWSQGGMLKLAEGPVLVRTSR